MRTISPWQRQTIAAQRVGHYFWAEIEHADRRYRDLTNLNGVDWVDSAEWSDSIDQPSGSFTLRLRRDTQTDSIAPTIGGAKANLLQNLLLWSEDFTNAAWIKANGGVGSLPVVTGNFGTAPDGTLTADRVQLALNGGSTLTDLSVIRQGGVTVVGKSYVLSVWLRTNDNTTKTVGLFVTSAGSSNVTVTPEWQRFTSIVWVATGTGNIAQIRLRGAEGNSDSADLLMWGAQVNQATSASLYTTTTTATVNTFAPLIDSGRNIRFYSAVTRDGLPPGTNYLLWSEDFSNAVWTKTTGVTITPNAVAAPDAAVTGDAIVYAGGGVAGSFRCYQGAQTPLAIVPAGVAFTASVWLRADVATTVRIANNHGQFTTCVLTTAWQRFSVAGVGTGASAAQLLIYSNTGDNAAWTIHAWGAQIDKGSLTDYVATTNVAALTTKRLVFQGRVDAVRWGSDPIELTGRDLGGWPIDAFIQQERVIGSATPTAIETLMAQVLSNDPVYGTPTLYTPASPGFLVSNPTGAKQAQKSVLEALQQDYALALGWVCRYRYDDTTSAFRLTFFDVNRAKSVADDSFGPTEYAEIPTLELNDAEVRNYIVGTYYDPAGKQHSRTVQNGTSQGKYGVKYMKINLALGDPIDSDAEMDAMLNAAVNDLGAPLTTQEMNTLYYWPIQLGDLYTFVQNGDHYDSDQKLAVVSFTHKFENGEGKTTMQCRGTVIGAYHAWFRRGIPGGDGTTSTDGIPEIQQVDVGFPAGTATVEVLLKGDINAGSWRIALSTVAQPDLTTTRAAPVYTGQNVDALISQSVFTGQKLYISVLAYSGVTGSGAESDLFQSSTTRDGVGGAVMPVPDIDLIYSDFTSFDLNFRATFSPGAPLPCEFRYGVSTDVTGATITWSAWTDKSFLPFHYGLTTRQDKAATYVYLEVRQGSDNTTIQRETIVMDGIDAATGSDGKIIRSAAFNDGGFALKATDLNGFIITSSGQESGLKFVNLLLAKPLSSSPDNLNSVGDGSTRAAVAPGTIDLNNAPLLIAIPDTRSVAHTPDYYNKTARGQFKDATVIGLPNHTSGMFAQVFGWRGWASGGDSGGGSGELAVGWDGRLYYRYGLSSSGWQAWNELARKSEVLSLAGGQTIAGALTISGNLTTNGALFITQPIPMGAGSTTYGYAGIATSTGGYINDAVLGDVIIRSQSPNSVRISGDSGATTALLVNSNGIRSLNTYGFSLGDWAPGGVGRLRYGAVISGWFDFINAANGFAGLVAAALQFQSGGPHFDWVDANTIKFQGGSTTTVCQIRTPDGTLRGYSMYADSSGFGWLSSGGSWVIRCSGTQDLLPYGDVVLQTAAKTFKDSFGNPMAPIIVSSSAASGTAADKTLWAQV